MPYTPTAWANGVAPAINATNLNKIETYLSQLGSRVFNVKDYGAVGDGITDDTAAIQAALTAADTAGAGRVVIPPGTYDLTAVLIVGSNIEIVGIGRPTLRIKSSAGNRDPRILSIVLQDNVLVTGLVLDGNEANFVDTIFTGGTLRCSRSNNVRFIDNEIKNFRIWGIECGWTPQTIVTDLVVMNNYVHHSNTVNTAVGIFLNNIYRGKVIGNTVTDVTDDGIALISVRVGTGAGSASIDYCHDVVIAGNVTDNCGGPNAGSGIAVTGERIACVGNTVRNNNKSSTVETGHSAIRVRNSDGDFDEYVAVNVTLVGNVIVGHMQNGINFRAADSICANNVIDASGVTNYGTGIAVEHAGATPVGGNGSVRVVNNEIRGQGVAGIHVVSAAFTQIAVENNTITGCASRGMRIKPISGCVNLSVRNNIVNGNTSDGMLLEANSVCSFVNIAGNQFTNNGGYGLTVGTPGTFTVFRYEHGIDSGNTGGGGAPQLNVAPTPTGSYRRGGTSTQTPGAVTTVNIAHVMGGVAPNTVSVEPADANARGAPAFHITKDTTNVILNFAAALTAATSYSWLWSAEI